MVKEWISGKIVMIILGDQRGSRTVRDGQVCGVIWSVCECERGDAEEKEVFEMHDEYVWGGL